MNSDMVLHALWSLGAGLLIGSVPFLVALTRDLLLKKEFDRLTPAHRPPPDPEDLSPAGLALLAGGPGRVAEVALMDAFLCGRVRTRPEGGLFSLVGPARPSAHEKGGVREELVEALGGQGGLSAYELVRGVVDGRAVERLRADLVESGLIMDSPRLRRMLDDRESAWVLVMAWWLVCTSPVIVTGVLCFVAWHHAICGFFFAALAIWTALGATQLLVWGTGGPVLSPNTAAGDAVVKLARDRYAVSPTDEPADAPSTMTRDHAVRHTAVTGFRALGRVTSKRGGVEAPSIRDLSFAPVHAGDTDTGSVRPEALYSFADFCQHVPPPGDDSRAGFAKGDGWGRAGNPGLSGGGAGDVGGGGC